MTSAGRFIGQLFGGAAYCGFPFDDYYGRFDLAWSGVGTYLDPGGSGVTSINGFDPSGTVSPPVLSSVSPPTVQAFQGGTLTLSGSNLSGVNLVTVGGTVIAPGSFTIMSPTTITLPAPTATALGTTNVSVSNSGGTSATKTFNYVETSPPKMTTTGFTQGGLLWSFEWGAGSNDKVILIYSIQPAAFMYKGYPVLQNFGIAFIQPLGPTGIGGLNANLPPGTAIFTLYTQLIAMHGTGGFAGASGILSTLVFP